MRISHCRHDHLLYLYRYSTGEYRVLKQGVLRDSFYYAKERDAMFEMQEDEHAQSDFTDEQLRYILAVYGPAVKDWLLLPGPVPLKLAANE
jgi:hypothetical protein